MDQYETDDSGAGIAVALLGGIALGALAMYLTDPVQGRQRRARARATMHGMTERTSDVMNSAWRDASSKFSGLQQNAGRLIGRRDSKPIDDHVLEARVRSRLSRIASNAHAIDVTADQGRVTLSGPVVSNERDAILELVQAIPGVESVRAWLDDGDGRGGWQPDALPMVALAGGVLLGYYGLTRRNRSGNDAIRAGLNWLSGNLRSVDWMGLFGGIAEGEPVVMERSIEIKAAPEEVFDVWSRYENFPHFMSHVAEVRDLGRQRSHWVVRGPGGADMEWNAVLTRSDRPHKLEWESEPGSMVENTGAIILEPVAGATRVTVRLVYLPPAGAVGRSVARLLGSDPERQLDDDLMRMRDFIERGVPLRGPDASTAKGQILH